jgi:hypothetical protein
MNDGRTPTAQSHTDVAALSAGVIAVAVTTMVTPGRYGGIATILSLTLLILIVSYSWRGLRTVAHSLAFAAVIGLVGMEIAGVGIETYLADHPWELFTGSDYDYAKLAAFKKAELSACLEDKPLLDLLPDKFECPPTRFLARLGLENIELDDKTRVDGKWLWVAWLGLFLVTLGIDRGRIFPGKWWPNSLSARTVGRGRIMKLTNGEAPGASAPEVGERGGKITQKEGDRA